MDVSMPVMGGMEATGNIRLCEEQEGWPRVPIIALTAHAMLGDREKCIEAGMVRTAFWIQRGQSLIRTQDEYVTKPLRRGDLLASIAKVLRQTTAPP